MTQRLDEQAIALLKKNDRGGFTVPTDRLYPYQWNWDSAFVALGFMKFDRLRGWRELEMLLEAQWDDGMVPHIIFRRNDPDYFPGPDVWQSPPHDLPSSGLSQPPILTTAVRAFVETGGQDDLERATKMFDDLMRWHRWFVEKRQPDGCPVVATVHPWETGRDNCPDWDLGMDKIVVDTGLGEYVRQDTVHAHVNERPTKLQYDRYLTIIKFGRDCGWDQAELTNNGPFLMADPCLHFTLLRANKDLAFVAKKIGRIDALVEIDKWIDAGTAGTDYLWNPKVQSFCARDVRTGEFSDGITNAGVLCFYAGVGTAEQHAAVLGHMERIGTKTKYLMPSWDPEDAAFEPSRYWRGPVWPQMNQIIAQGLAECGHEIMAERIRANLAEMIEFSGFWECFNPMTGAGCVGQDFSWTAAVWLSWLSPTRPAIAA